MRLSPLSCFVLCGVWKMSLWILQCGDTELWSILKWADDIVTATVLSTWWINESETLFLPISLPSVSRLYLKILFSVSSVPWCVGSLFCWFSPNAGQLLPHSKWNLQPGNLLPSLELYPPLTNFCNWWVIPERHPCRHTGLQRTTQCWTFLQNSFVNTETDFHEHYPTFGTESIPWLWEIKFWFAITKNIKKELEWEFSVSYDILLCLTVNTHQLSSHLPQPNNLSQSNSSSSVCIYKQETIWKRLTIKIQTNKQKKGDSNYKGHTNNWGLREMMVGTRMTQDVIYTFFFSKTQISQKQI